MASLRPALCLAALMLVKLGALAQDPAHPLQPPDRSSPRATLQSFLASADAVGASLRSNYLTQPTRANFERLSTLGNVALQSLDLSEVPPAARAKTGPTAALALYEVLSRIALPAPDQIPDAAQLKPPDGKAPLRWVIPNTEIALVRVQEGPRSGEFLFSPDTVARAGEFYERVNALPYRRPVPQPHLHEIVVAGGGWMVPYAWTQALPPALRAPIAGQAAWKWVGLVLLLGVATLFLWLVFRVSQRGDGVHPFVRALAQFAMPVAVLTAAPALAYLALVQLNLIGSVGAAFGLAMATVAYLAGAWVWWRLAPMVAEAIIASPNIPSESVDAHLIRISARLIGILGTMALLAFGADRLGLPVYGIIAGLGVGGLAIALAAQPTIENLIGGMNLFADKPMRVGDLCKYGDALGVVEAIGIRSTRMRGIDRALTTIPNAALDKMPIVNLTRRDCMLIQAVIGLRYETTPEQLRYVLVKLRELLLGHPRVQPDTARARFVGFGASSLDLEAFGYVTTSDWPEFLGIREDILLRVMDIVEQAGTGMAFPSQTLYVGRDGGLDAAKAAAAVAQVQAWRDEGALPFPNFSPEQADRLRASVLFPPVGSVEAVHTGTGARADAGTDDRDPRPR
ncbi:MAG: mechanosensitive ion channel family protein [Burkholderiales bacterium]|nr:mechanosensitive ion channel family protein [Burkholderiales bacterium]